MATDNRDHHSNGDSEIKTCDLKVCKQAKKCHVLIAARYKIRENTIKYPIPFGCIFLGGQGKLVLSSTLSLNLQVQHLKERFFPPTGGCFRTGTSHRYRSRLGISERRLFFLEKPWRVFGIQHVSVGWIAFITHFYYYIFIYIIYIYIIILYGSLKREKWFHHTLNF